MRAKRSNLGFNEINALEIAASLTLLAMTTKNEFFRNLLKLQMQRASHILRVCIHLRGEGVREN